ncbi:Fc receptor-like protein 5 [Corvus hawaiiensis]|uniref:Fc receptor-like protein 5 n=1 Tax=Corvus hawaiiensis TaxID=134902 RepID=UPI00201A1558|nr:Fc receptor-like protein 5 [Corvus hawaiiensis]
METPPRGPRCCGDPPWTCVEPLSAMGPPCPTDRLVLQVPARALLEGDTVTLRCRNRKDTSVSRVRFYQDEMDLGRTLNGTELSLSPLQPHHSGRYHCEGLEGFKLSRSVPVTVTVHVPVANATISPGALAQPVRAGDPVTLRCSVQVSSAPVTFTWLHNSSEVARGPLLELGGVHVGHSGTYQCLATNQLGQDGHHVFRALSPELALTVTPRAHWDTGGVTRGHWDCSTPAVTGDPDVSPSVPSSGCRAHPQPPAPLVEEPQATYMELLGPHRQPWEPSDIYDNLQQKL